MMAQSPYRWKAGTNKSQNTGCKMQNERSNLTKLLRLLRIQPQTMCFISKGSAGTENTLLQDRLQYQHGPYISLLE
jgi:hypothetical protein